MLALATAALIYLQCPVRSAEGDWEIRITLNELKGEMVYEESPSYVRSFKAVFGQSIVSATTDIGSVITIDRSTLILTKTNSQGKVVKATCKLQESPTRAF